MSSSATRKSGNALRNSLPLAIGVGDLACAAQLANLFEPLVGIGLLGFGVGGRPRLAAECRARDRVARTGSAPRARRRTRLPVTRSRCSLGGVASASAAARRLPCGPRRSRADPAERSVRIAARLRAARASLNRSPTTRQRRTPSPATARALLARPPGLPRRRRRALRLGLARPAAGGDVAAGGAAGRSRRLRSELRGCSCASDAQTSGSCSPAARADFAHGLGRERRVVLHAALDHDRHDQHDRSSKRDRRAPAQPRARARRAAARDSSTRFIEHATIELGRHVLAAELAIALRNVGAPFQVLVQRLDVDRVAHDCTLGSNCRGRCWRSAVRSLPTA